jgi:hypothetical protein
MRNLGDALKFKTDADLDRVPRDLGKKSVIKSRASTEPASFLRESQTGHNNEI